MNRRRVDGQPRPQTTTRVFQQIVEKRLHLCNAANHYVCGSRIPPSRPLLKRDTACDGAQRPTQVMSEDAQEEVASPVDLEEVEIQRLGNGLIHGLIESS